MTSGRGGARTARRVSAAAAAALVRSGDWVDYGVALCEPDAFDRALAERVPDLHGITIRSMLSMRPRAVLEADPDGERVQWLSWHFSGYDRAMGDVGRASYIPGNLGEIAGYYRRFIEPPAVAVLKTCPMDQDGFFNFSAANLWHRAVVERARVVVVEESPGLPHLFGSENAVHVSEVDYVIAGDDAPPPELTNPPPGEADRAVARLVAGEVEDGACLQVGIGRMPDAVCALLLDSGVRDLGVHTEMLTDGIIALYRAGLVTGVAKTVFPGQIVCTFGLGSGDFYSTIDRNRDIRCEPVDRVNPPHLIMRNEKMTAINTTTQVDLQGQAASESAGHRHLSGTGGQAQFVRGAYASAGGKSLMCLASTFEKHGERTSRIVLDLTPGNVVTTGRSDMMYVVTEYGMVNLKGRSVPERAAGLIGIAHPDFREELSRQAREHGLLPRAYR